MGDSLLLVSADCREHPLIIERYDLLEQRNVRFKVIQDLPSEFRSRFRDIFGQNIAELRDIIFFSQFLQNHHIFIDSSVQAVVLIQHIGNSAAHTCREVLARSPQDHRAAACHVLQSVVAASFRDRHRAGIADAEALSRDAVNKCFAACRAVESDVADDDILARVKPAGRIRYQHKFAAR